MRIIKPTPAIDVGMLNFFFLILTITINHPVLCEDILFTNILYLKSSFKYKTIQKLYCDVYFFIKVFSGFVLRHKEVNIKDENYMTYVT